MKTKLTLSLLVAGLALSGAEAQDGKQFGDGTLPEFLQQCDANGNGMIDPEERQAMALLSKERRAELRDQWDTDDDGRLSPQECEQARQQVRDRIEQHREDKFNEIASDGDDDGDGELEEDDFLIDRDEFGDIPGLVHKPEAYVDLLFAHLDTNEDTFISYEEFTVRLQRHRKQPGPGGGGSGGGK